jgi:3'(2'), 5'-bisphosphate nucleotidase
MSLDNELAALIRGGVIDQLTAVICRAAAAIAAIDRSAVKWRTKPDLSPVSVADEAANRVIVEGLSHLFPAIPIISEEDASSAAFEAPGVCFALVDPLDGTREFLAGRDEFTVNIAIVLNGRSKIGLIAAPAVGLLWRGIVGRGAERLPLAAALPQTLDVHPVTVRRRPADGLVVTVSRSHLEAQTEAFLRRLPIATRVACGSSLKFCRIAEGRADLYVRLSQTCEWDTAAGHAIVAAAGGTVTAPDGAELVYGRAADGFRIPGFIAWGDPAIVQSTLRACSGSAPT